MPAAIVDRDETLAVLLAELSDRLRAGGPADVEAVARRHPSLATELRELWAVAQFAQLARHAVAAPPPEADPTPAHLPRAFGDFELLGELGRGGMGVVYRARQKALNRVVAVKMVREAHLATDADRARFRAEAEAAARLQHRNIVTVFEVGSHDGQAYLVMEYVPGRTLGQLVAGGPLPSRIAARLVAAVARAVEHAHAHGILHRDLKPSNILLADAPPGPDGLPWEPKITDFGLAKQADRAESLTRTGAVVGTPSYMAPEQATGRRHLTPAADVYSLGAVLYELLTGRPPFRAATPVDTLLLVLEQEPVRPRDLVPSVDRDLELVCLKCLQKPADLRYRSAAALAADLDAFLAGEPMTVEPGSFGSLVARMMRETHHAAVLENWGVLWMWHSLAIFLICLATQVMAWRGVDTHGAYLALWGTGLFTWGGMFWRLRRRGGPVLFVERQIAHAWAGSVAGSVGLFVIEVVQGLPALTLSPVLAVIAGVVFFFKAGTLSGQFYVSAVGFFATAGVMAAVPQVGHLLFGLVSAAAFFAPGLKYYRQRRRGLAAG
jgi:serine/threonine-protein kinase